jgi:hypothetical protein
MPELLSFDLKQLVRVCLNDPDLRADVFAAIDEGPLPLRTPCANVVDGDHVYSGIVRSDREKSPGDPGFIAKDNLGWISARLSEVVKTTADASTMSADQVASQLGVNMADLLKKK